MAEITISQGYKVLVDDEDFERLNRRWSAKPTAYGAVYARRTLTLAECHKHKLTKTKTIYIHHEVLGVLPWETNMEVDHIDGNPLNNRKSNLRIVSKQENIRSCARIVNAKGYSFDSRSGKYLCRLSQANGTRKFVGYADSVAEAEQMLIEAKERSHQ